ncbi:MAG: hypothetical protein V1898_03000 [Patescibacteria group bacterium]
MSSGSLTKNSNILEKANNIISKLSQLEKNLDLEKQTPIKPEQIQPKELSEKEKAQQEYIKRVDDEHPEESPYVIKGVAKKSTATSTKSKTLEEIEEILEEKVDILYEKMNDKEKAEFKAKGEEISAVIEDMVTNFKTKARRVLELIKEWLSIIPHVNRFFLEQEAKIKTQKIVLYARKYKFGNKNKW